MSSLAASPSSTSPSAAKPPAAPAANTVLLLLRAVPVALLALALALGVWTAVDIRETVRDEFNQQQLALARQVASRVAATIQVLRRELDGIAVSFAENAEEPGTMAALLRASYASAAPLGLVEARYVDAASGQTVAVKQHGRVVSEPLGENDRHLIAHPEAFSTLAGHTAILEAPSAPKDRPLMIVATALEPGGTARGILYFLVDERQLAGNAVAGIRSGRTGYGWIVNADGVFLAHPLPEFVGQDAFQARESRQPAISYARINEIQRQRMLAGQEGTDWYISEMREGSSAGSAVEKLIGFAPIPIGGQGGHRSWSVAVVAPVSEVEATVNGLWLKVFGSLCPAALAIAVVMVLIVSSQRQARRLRWEIEAVTRRLEKCEAKYKTLAESDDDLIYTIDAEGRLLTANRSALRFLAAGNGADGGWRSAEEVIGADIRSLFSPEAGELLLREVKDVLRQGRGVSREYSVVVGEREYWLSTKLRPLEEPDLGANVVLAISRDTTQKRMLDEQMFNTEKLASLGTLAAGVAHELNNPLTAILGFTELLLERFPPGSREYQDLKVIEEQSQHCRHVVENLLDYAKTGVPLGELTNINDDIEAVLRIVANTALTNKIAIDYNLDPRMPYIRANSREIRQVLLNLVNNAIYAMRERGGKLTVFSAVRGNRIMIKVADTGTGIPQDLLGRIFDPFFTTKGPGEGTGLGLSVSLGLVQRLGGTITVSSSTEGSHEGEPTGSIFTVILPLPNEGAATP